jgi:TRAP-type C4-dicarboxylate transport system substrate-binding protein
VFAGVTLGEDHFVALVADDRFRESGGAEKRRRVEYGIGAFVIKKDTFARLSAEDQARFREGGRETGVELRALVRRDNERAQRAMVKSGVVMFHVPDEDQAKLMESGKQVWGRLAGKIYSKAMLDKVLAAIASMPPS